LQILVILNPRARGAADTLALGRNIYACLRAEGAESNIVYTTLAGEATDLAASGARDGYDLIAAAGGDGTANEVLNGLAGTGVRFGVIPAGTANSLAHYLGLQPGDVGAACHGLVHGQTRTLDLGLINGRYFLGMAGIGLDAYLAHHTRGAWKKWLGVYAYVEEFLDTLVDLDPWHMELLLDGRKIEGGMWGVFICNTPRYVWRMEMGVGASETDGELDVVLLRESSREGLFKVAVDLFLRGKPVRGEPGMEVIRAKEIGIRTDPPAYWEVDGEVGGLGPSHCHVVPGALELVVPGSGAH
jgi:YegS/Rv2252/BmrU family lipid kinase